MDKMVKILIIVCIILVTGFGLTTGMLIENNSGMNAAQNNFNGNQSVQNTAGVNNGSETKHVTNKNSSVISAADVQSRMQLLVNANNGEGCSVEYPELNSQKTVYHAAVDGMDGYIGDIYINSQTGDLIKLSWVHD